MVSLSDTLQDVITRRLLNVLRGCSWRWYYIGSHKGVLRIHQLASQVSAHSWCQ